MIDDDIRRTVDVTPIAHLATLLPDGSPQNVPMWIGTHRDRIADDGAPAQLQLARERAAATAGMLIGNTVPTTNNAMSAMIETNAVLGSRASWPVVCVFGDCNLHCWLSGLANSSVHHVSIEWRHVSW